MVSSKGKASVRAREGPGSTGPQRSTGRVGVLAVEGVARAATRAARSASAAGRRRDPPARTATPSPSPCIRNGSVAARGASAPSPPAPARSPGAWSLEVGDVVRRSARRRPRPSRRALALAPRLAVGVGRGAVVEDAAVRRPAQPHSGASRSARRACAGAPGSPRRRRRRSRSSSRTAVEPSSLQVGVGRQRAWPSATQPLISRSTASAAGSAVRAVAWGSPRSARSSGRSRASVEPVSRSRMIRPRWK